MAPRLKGSASGNREDLVTEHEDKAAVLEPPLEAVARQVSQDVELSALLEKADALRDLDRLSEAEAAYRDLVAKAPDVHDGPRGLGLVAARRGDYTSALAHFQHALALKPGNLWVIHDVANALRELGRFDEAEAAFLEFTAKAPHLYDGHRGLGLVFRQRGDCAAALTHFRRARDMAPENPWQLKDTADLLRETDHFDEAEVAYRELVALAPHFYDGHRGLGLLASRSGDHAAALEHFSAARAVAPENAWLINDAGNALRMLGRLDEAKSAYREFSAKAPHIFDGPRGLGLVARERGDNDNALEHFLAALALAPDNLWLIHDAAKAFCALGRLDEAEAVYRDLGAKAPHLSDGPRGLAFVARQRGDHAAALAHSQSALNLAPDDIWLINDVANALRELSRLDEAEAAYRELMAKAPQLLDGPRGLGLVSSQRGDHATALAHFQAALALAPDNVTLLQEVASQLQELGRQAEAENLLQSIVVRRPDSAQALIAYAKSIRHRISEDELIRLFEKAMALEPSDLSAKLALADEYLKIWRLDAAATLYDAIHFEPGGLGWGLFGKGHIARRRGQRDEALTCFAGAMDTPLFEWATIETSRELMEAGRFEEARDCLQAAIERDPVRLSWRLQQGYNARSINDHKAAHAAFAAAATMSPDERKHRLNLQLRSFISDSPARRSNASWPSSNAIPDRAKRSKHWRISRNNSTISTQR